MRTAKKIVLALLALALLVICFMPFPNVPHNKEGELQYCRYRLAVYEFRYIEAEGEGYGESDTFFCNIILRKKIGGSLEYFGLNKIENQE